MQHSWAAWKVSWCGDHSCCNKTRISDLTAAFVRQRKRQCHLIFRLLCDCRTYFSDISTTLLQLWYTDWYLVSSSYKGCGGKPALIFIWRWNWCSPFTQTWRLIFLACLMTSVATATGGLRKEFWTIMVWTEPSGLLLCLCPAADMLCNDISGLESCSKSLQLMWVETEILPCLHISVLSKVKWATFKCVTMVIGFSLSHQSSLKVVCYHSFLICLPSYDSKGLISVSIRVTVYFFNVINWIAVPNSPNVNSHTELSCTCVYLKLCSSWTLC